MNNEIYTFNSLNEILNFIKIDAEKNLFCEICGFIGINKNNKFIYKRMANKSKNPESYFIIDPYDFLNFIKDYSLLVIYHSHLFGDANPSEFDQKTS
jgi:proteasome lid subunit RPN8/RPN11